MSDDVLGGTSTTCPMIAVLLRERIRGDSFTPARDQIPIDVRCSYGRTRMAVGTVVLLGGGVVGEEGEAATGEFAIAIKRPARFEQLGKR